MPRDEVVVILAKDGRTLVDVHHENPNTCKQVDARMRAAFALLGLKLTSEHSEDPARAIPIPEAVRTKGGSS